MKIQSTKLFPSNFNDVFNYIFSYKFVEYIFKGGRGSCKSSFISICIILLIVMIPGLNAIALRKVGDTLEDSVYSQLQWAINTLGLDHKFKCTTKPMRIIYMRKEKSKETWQKIIFKGCDKPVKIKSIKVPHGWIGILWFEEWTEFTPAEVRSIKQSAIRKGSKNFVFESYNPPMSSNNWVNEESEIEKPNRFVHKSDYTTVNKSWLGEFFIHEAEHLKKTNEKLYNNEYLGLVTGTGLNIFENLEIRTITDDEINTLEWFYSGIDWGYFPDPFVYMYVSYDAKRKWLYLIKEFYTNKQGNYATSEALQESGVDINDRVTADSAEQKSIGDYREYGWNIKGAIKGPGSRDYSYKWLQSLEKIIIDKKRTPRAYQEFKQYEYKTDRNGEILNVYPDKDDHSMDATRYSLESVWQRKGA